MTKLQKYWAPRQEQKIKNLEHDWNELGYMRGGEQEEKFSVLVPAYKKPPKIRLLKLFFKGGFNGHREVELRSSVSIGHLEQDLGHELDKQKRIFQKCKDEDFTYQNCLYYGGCNNDCFYKKHFDKEDCKECHLFEFKWDYEDEIIKRV